MMGKRRLGLLVPCLILFCQAVFSADVASGTEAAPADILAWWIAPVGLFFFSLIIGVVAVMAGVGGGVLFVPLVSGFAPFHLDFVRGAGLCVALAGAVAASPHLLRSGMANLRIAMPLSLLASISAIGGATLGLALPVSVTQTALGVTIMMIAGVMAWSRSSEYPTVGHQDALSKALHMHGIFHDYAEGRDVYWQTHRTPLSMVLFLLIGLMAGMFGLGAGWANVPVLNLVMGAPLKVAVATSKFMLSIVDASAVWVYINHGAVLAMVAVPSVIGIMLGSRIGVKLLAKTDAAIIKRMVIVLLLVSGGRALLKGLGIWN